MNENSQISDAMTVALQRARDLGSGVGMVGYGVAVVRDPDGNVKQCVPFANLVTTAGDQYYAQMGIALVGTPNTAQPTKANGMKLGTGSTAASKSGAGSFIGTYISGSNVAFDAAYPQASAVGSDVGWHATYQTTWAAGTATNSAIVEVAIVTDRATDTQGAAASTISRAIISSVNKAAGDSLTITWNHKFLGA